MAQTLDLELAFKADRAVRDLAGRIPTADELWSLAKSYDLNIATMIFFKSLLESPLHGEFIRALQSSEDSATTLQMRSHEPVAGRRDWDIVIVPSTTLESGMPWGSHVDWVRRIARQQGFGTEVISTHSQNTIAENARVISDFLLRSFSRPIILVTCGQGTLETEFLLRKRGPGSIEATRLKSWISMAGARTGFRYYDLVSKSFFSRWRAKMDHRVWNRNPLVISEAVTSLWASDMAKLPRNCLFVQLMGVPLAQHLPRSLRSHYRALSSRGPNDGVSLLADYAEGGGFLYPVWGMSAGLRADLLTTPLERALVLAYRASVEVPTSRENRVET